MSLPVSKLKLFGVLRISNFPFSHPDLEQKHGLRGWNSWRYRRSCLRVILNNSLQCRLNREWKGEVVYLLCSSVPGMSVTLNN